MKNQEKSGRVPSPVHWRGKASWVSGNWWWNTDIWILLSGSGGQQLSVQVGVRTGYIPELGKCFMNSKKNGAQMSKHTHEWTQGVTEHLGPRATAQIHSRLAIDKTRPCHLTTTSCLQRKGDLPYSVTHFYPHPCPHKYLSPDLG